jgi:hypothetical protein
MNHVLSVSLLALCLLVPAAYADDKGDVATAQGVATAWLALTDGAKYAESWDSAARPGDHQTPAGQTSAAARTPGTA